MFLPLQEDELHYSELAVGASSSSLTAKKLLSVDCGNLTELPSGNTSGSHVVSVRKILPSLTSKSLTVGPPPGPPPPPPPLSYDYYEEPAIYAQIDRYKGGVSASGVGVVDGAETAFMPPCISSSPASQGTPSTASPGTVQMYTLPQHPGGYHTLPLNHHQPNVTALGSTSMMQMMAARPITGATYQYHGTLPMPPSYQQHQKQQQQQIHLQQQGSISTPMTMTMAMAMTTTTTATATTATAATLNSPSGSLSAIGKSYSREIVTVRTPLMYSQQESCV